MMAATDGLTSLIALFVLVLGLVIAVVWVTFPFIVRKKLDEIISIGEAQGKWLVEIHLAISKLQPVSLGAPPKRLESECKCNTCSGLIQVAATDTGKTIACPHCGIETILYLPIPA